jgi:hypothetical protein
MKTYGGVDVLIQDFSITTLMQVSGQFQAPVCLPHGKVTPGTDWLDPRVCLDDMEKWIFLTLPGLELQPLGRRDRKLSLYRLRYRDSLQSAVREISDSWSIIHEHIKKDHFCFYLSVHLTILLFRQHKA